MAKSKERGHLGDPRVKDVPTRKALGYPDASGEWNEDMTHYKPRPGVKIPARATNRNIDDATGKPRKR